MQELGLIELNSANVAFKWLDWFYFLASMIRGIKA